MNMPEDAPACNMASFKRQFGGSEFRVQKFNDLTRGSSRSSKKRTKKELIHFALTELIRREKAKGILDLEGAIDWDGDLRQMRKARFANPR